VVGAAVEVVCHSEGGGVGCSGGGDPEEIQDGGVGRGAEEGLYALDVHQEYPLRTIISTKSSASGEVLLRAESFDQRSWWRLKSPATMTGQREGKERSRMEGRANESEGL